ncbi:hypothetical protein NUW54_g6797 [Trametes sanguinea]|uniref:Uncharacterized protein n=1 Tax=Trametes sanguinea TaxID=158606 RepID=A0ACC1PTS8_9APHY|nr:hypothetical protein NUW54_g6797 [Trametes sanguinea]
MRVSTAPGSHSSGSITINDPPCAALSSPPAALSSPPALLSQVLLPFVEKGERKVILHISSTAGSMQSVPQIGVIYGSYSMSKAAYNMLAQKQRIERPDLTIITMCPGPVKTDMNPIDGQIEPEESVQGILRIVTSVNLGDSGKYLRYNGEVIPW